MEAEKSTKKNKRKYIRKSAYLLPYKRENGKTLYLLGRKQIISYLSLKMFDQDLDDPQQQKKFLALKESIIAGSFELNHYNHHTPIRTRFNGCLLAAGGKHCIIGGRIGTAETTGRGEEYKQAAIRELVEELRCGEVTLIDEQAQERLDPRLVNYIQLNQPNELCHYYATHLDDDKNELLQTCLADLKKLNDAIMQFEDNITSDNIIDKIQQIKSDEDLPEMHRVSWIELGDTQKDIEDYFNQIDEGYINSQIEIFCRYLVNKLNNIKNNNDSSSITDDQLTVFMQRVKEYMIHQEKNDWHINAIHSLRENSKRNLRYPAGQSPYHKENFFREKARHRKSQDKTTNREGNQKTKAPTSNPPSRLITTQHKNGECFTIFHSTAERAATEKTSSKSASRKTRRAKPPK